MDVCKPDLEYIDGICYRINPSNCSIPSSYGNTMIYNEDDGDCSIHTTPKYSDENEVEFLNDIEEVEGGRYKTSFHVPSVFFPYIVGMKRATLMRIESETKAKLGIPRPGQTGDVVITGPDKYSVASARKRVNGIVSIRRAKTTFTHFIGIPLVFESFQQSFLTFKERVLEVNKEIDEKLFKNEHRLHITLCMLVLCDDVDRNHASKVFQECKETLISPMLSGKNLLLDITGVDSFNDDPTSVRVLFAKVSFPEHPTLLQELGDGIVSFFDERGLLDNRSKKPLNLHVTLMNSKFLQTENSKKRDHGFNATAIIKEFKNFHFGQVIVNRMDLSTRFSTDQLTLYYQTTSTTTLP